MSDGDTPRIPDAGRREGGIALVLCLLVLTILIVVVFQLSYTTKVNLRLAKNRLDTTVMHYAVRGAVARAKEYVKADTRENEWDALTDLWATTSITADEGLEDYDYDEDPWSEETVGEEGGESRIDLEVVIVDEERKLNLTLMREPPERTGSNRDSGRSSRGGKDGRNQSRNNDRGGGGNRKRGNDRREPSNKAAQKKLREKVFNALISILSEFREGTPFALTGGEARDIATNIRDYVTRPRRRDAADDEVPTPQTLDYPMLTTDELLLIDGVTEDLLYDFPDPDDETLVVPGLLNFVTVWSSGLVNVNTAPEVVLRSLFDDKDRDRATDILDVREQIEDEANGDRPPSSSDRGQDEEESTPGVFKDVSELQNDILDNESYQEILPFITTRSTVFSVHVLARRGKIRLHERTVLRRVGSEVYPLFSETRRDRLLWGREDTELQGDEGDDFLF